MDNWPRDDDERLQWCISQGIDLEHHCCLNMAYAISKPLLRSHQGPNRVLDWIAAWNEYRIPVPYDGYSSTLISFCPFCGTRLPASRREEWYQTLYDLEYSDPGEEDIPPEFDSDRWWRDRG